MSISKTNIKTYMLSLVVLILCLANLGVSGFAIAKPDCMAEPNTSNGQIDITILCINVVAGSKVSIPNTTCLPAVADASKMVKCVENPNANISTNPTLTIKGADNTVATLIVDYTFDNVAPKTPTINTIPTTNQNVYPPISGTCEAGSTVQVLLGVIGYTTDLLYSACSADGTYLIDKHNVAIPVGTNKDAVSVNAYDISGNLSSYVTANVPVTRTGADITPPNAPRLIEIPELNANQLLPIEGACEPAATVNVKLFGDVLQTKCNNNGSFKVIPANKVLYGKNTDVILVTQVDVAGNVSKASVGSYPVTDQASTSALLAPIVDPISPNNTNPNPVVTGKCVVGTTVRITPVVGTVVEGACSAQGTFAIKLLTPLDVSPNQAELIINQFTALATSPNVVVDSPLSAVKTDTIAPIAPTINAIPSSNTDPSPNITGTCEVGAKVVVKVNNNAIGEVICSNSATYSAKVPFILPGGTNTIEAKQIDGAGNVSPIANSSFQVITKADNIAPALPKSEPIVSTNTKASPIIRGTCEPLATLKLTLGGSVVSPDEICGPNGRFAFDLEAKIVQIPLGKNPGYIRITQTDEAGNTSGVHTADAPVNIADRVYTSTPTIDPILKTNTDTTPDISGSCESGITVQLTTYASAGGGTVYKVQCFFGRFRVTPTVPFKIGTTKSGIEAVQIDSNGKKSYYGFQDVYVIKAVDTPKIAIPTINKIPLTNISPNPTLSGTCTPGYDVNISIYGQSSSIPCLNDGTYFVISPVTLRPQLGLNKIEVKQTKGTNSSESVYIDAPFNEPTIRDPKYLINQESFYNTYDTTPILSGDNCNEGYEVTVILPSETLKTVCQDLGSWANNYWYVQVTKDLPRGANTNIAKVYQSNFINKQSNQTPFSVQIDQLSNPVAKVILNPIPDNNKNSTPQITGQCIPNYNVIVQIGPMQEYTYCGENALFSINVNENNPLPQGPNLNYISAFQAIEGKFSEVSKISAPYNVTFKDTTAPTAPTINSLPNPNFNPNPEITGTCETDATVSITINQITTTQICKSAKYSITPATKLNSGTNAVTVFQTDPSNNVSTTTSSSINYTVNTDTTAPIPVVITSISNTQKPVITGTCETDAIVEVIINTTVQPKIKCIGGTFTLTSNIPLPTGVNKDIVKIAQTDNSGNKSNTTTASAPITDTTPPSIPTINPISATNTIPKPIISGGCEPQASVIVTVSGTTLAPVVCSASGLYQANILTDLPVGANPGLIKVTQVDAAGNKSPEAIAAAPLKDNTPPAKPTFDIIPLDNRNPKPPITGTCEEGAKVFVNINRQNFLTTCKLGKYSVVPTLPVSLGANTNIIEIWQVDPSGNKSASVIGSAPLKDGVAPKVITIDLIPMTNSNNKPTISGTCESGSTVKLEILGDIVFVSCINGKYSAASLIAIPEGSNIKAIKATQTDVGGNTSAPVYANIPVVDITPPPIPTIDAIPLTNNSSIINIQGKCDEDSTVYLVINNINLASQSCASGRYSIELQTGLKTGPNIDAFLVYQKDKAGNKSPDAKANAPIGDNTPPVAVTMEPIIATNDIKRPTIKGKCEPLAAVNISLKGVVQPTINCNSAGTYTYTFTTDLPEGVNTGYIKLTQKDQAGNLSPEAIYNAPMKDVTAPLAVTMNDIPVTNNNSLPILTGTCEKDAIVDLTISATVKYQANCPTGTYSIQLTTKLPIGPNTGIISITQTDSAGNKSVSIVKNAPVVSPIVGPLPKLAVPTIDTFPINNTNPNPIITGTCFEGAIVIIAVLNTGYETPCINNKYEIRVTETLPIGPNTSQLRVSQRLGSGTPSEIIISNIPRSPATIIKPTVKPIPVSNTNKQPVISGTCTLGKEVLIKTKDSYTTLACSPTPIARMAFFGIMAIDPDVLDGYYSAILSDIFPLGANPDVIEALQFDKIEGLVSDVAIAAVPVVDITPPVVVTIDPIEVGNTDPTPNITGTCEDGATVLIEYLSNPVVEFVCTFGTYFYTPPTDLAVGKTPSAVTVSQKDTSGNVSDKVSITGYYADTTPPIEPIVDTIAKSNQNPQPLLTGICESPSKVILSLNEGVSIELDCINDTFSYQVDSPIPQGANKEYISAYSLDEYGNRSFDALYDLPLLDTSVPDAPTIDPLPFDNFNQIPNIGGECDGEGTVVVTVGLEDLYSTDCTAGFWSIQVTKPIPVGPYVIYATITDKIGQTSEVAISKEIITQKDDVTAPQAPIAFSTNPNNTNPTPTFYILCEPGTQLLIKVFDIVQPNVACSFEGDLIFQVTTPLSTGYFAGALSIVQTDPSGNVSPAYSGDLALNQLPINEITFNVMQLGNTDTTPTLEGQCAGYEKIEILVNGTTILADCKANQYSATYPIELANGVYNAKVVGIAADGIRTEIAGVVPVNAAIITPAPIPTPTPTVKSPIITVRTGGNTNIFALLILAILTTALFTNKIKRNYYGITK
jgi:large repetitive protein